MRGVILAGGLGTRLNPLTEITNKHLLPVGQEPMIWHPVRQLVDAGIHAILIVTSLGSGKRFGCDCTYRVPEDAGGIAQALALSREFAAGEPIVVLLGDNIFESSIKPHVDEFRAQERGARVLLKEVGDPERLGIAALDETVIIEIEEKPAEPKSSHAVVGCYMYDENVHDLIDETETSERGEMEITSVNNLYIQRRELEYSFVRGRWTDAGTFESLDEANRLLLSIGNEILP